MKFWMKLAIIIGIPVIVAGFILVYQGSPKEITAVADQFQPESSWKLIDERIVPPAITCLEANCPSVHRSWKTGENLTKEEFQKVLSDSGWDFEIEGDCVPSENISGSTPLCSASSSVQNYVVSVTVWGSYDLSSGGSVILSLGKQ